MTKPYETHRYFLRFNVCGKMSEHVLIGKRQFQKVCDALNAAGGDVSVETREFETYDATQHQRRSTTLTIIAA